MDEDVDPVDEEVDPDADEPDPVPLDEPPVADDWDEPAPELAPVPLIGSVIWPPYDTDTSHAGWLPLQDTTSESTFPPARASGGESGKLCAFRFERLRASTVCAG